jgi:KDO2-lipid IV(A) lauroyltransferase
MEYAVLRGLMAAVGRSPRRPALRFGEMLGRAWFRMDDRHVRIGMANLRIAFPDWDDDRRMRTLKLSLENVGRLAVEVCQSRRWSESDILRLIGPEDPDAPGRVIGLHREAGALFFYTGHVGAWELLTHYWAVRAEPMHAVARPIDNPLVDEVLTGLRERRGTRIIGKRGAIREVLQSVHRGHYVAMLVDQNTVLKEGMFVQFFGKPACSLYTLPLLAVRSGIPLVGGFTHYDRENDRHEVILGPNLTKDLTGDRDEDVRRLTQQMHTHIEEVIRRKPEQWLWMHRRWRTRPPEEADLPPVYDKR